MVSMVFGDQVMTLMESTGEKALGQEKIGWYVIMRVTHWKAVNPLYCLNKYINHGITNSAILQ